MKGNMKALRKMKPGPGLEMQEIPIPAIKANEVLIKVYKRAICGTDLHIYKWDEWSQNRLKPPVTTGHEFYGEIVETGADVGHYKKGDLVTAEMHVVCNQCFQCRTGNAHLCENVVILGVDGDGCFADYLAVPESNLWRVPAGIDPEWAAIYDPFGNAVHTVMAGPTVGKSFLILGGGPIGIAAVPVCKAAGASMVLLSEVMPFRQELARKMGADRVIDPAKENVAEVVALADRRPGRGRGAGDVGPPGRHRSRVPLHPQERPLFPAGHPGQAARHRPGRRHHFPRHHRPGHQRPAHVRDLVPDGRPAGLGQGRPEAADHPPFQDGGLPEGFRSGDSPATPARSSWSRPLLSRSSR